MVWTFDSNSYFVDPAQADDTGDGKTEATAKKTLSAGLLLCSAGDTLFLAGGTHTVVGGTTLSIPTKVNLVGGGPKTTYITGDATAAAPYLEFNGENVIEGLNLTSTGVNGSQVIGTLSANGPSDLIIRNCSMSSVGIVCDWQKPSSGTTRVLFEECEIASDNGSGNNVDGNVDITFRHCSFAGSNDAFYSSLTGALDQTNCQAIDCSFFLTSNADCFSLTSSTPASINAVAKGCTFITGTGYVVNSNGTSTGVPAFVDAGGNNIADADVNLAGVATFTRTWADANNAAVEAGQVGTDASGANTNGQILVTGMPWEVLCTGHADAAFNVGSYGSFVIWDSGAPVSDAQYKDHLIVFADGQTRWLAAVDITDPDITVDRPFEVLIPNTTTFKIYNVIHSNLDSIEANLTGTILHSSILQAGGTTTVTLDALANVADNFYNGCLIQFSSGLGNDSTRFIEAYDGTTKVATLDVALTSDPGAVGFTIYNQRSSTTQIRPSGDKRIAGEGTTAKNLDQVSGGVVGGGGAPVHGRMDYVGFLDNRVLDVIQGEEQRLTVVLETDGTFALPVTTITVEVVDVDGNVVTINDADVSRVVEDSQVYVMRFTLTAAQSATLSAGALNLEVTLDDSKSQILSALEIIASLS